MKIEYLLVILLSASLLAAALIVRFANKGERKRIREAEDRVRTDWVNAYAAQDKLREKEADALKYALSVKDDVIDAKNQVIKEKNMRIEELESEIAMCDMIMACAKIDGSIDKNELKRMLEESNGKRDKNNR